MRDPFDEIKLVVNAHCATWVSRKIVLTEIVKCRAHRKTILWNVVNPGKSMLWTCKEISPLWDVGTVHQADLTINGDRHAGRRAPESQRVVREDANEQASGGVRNVARVMGGAKLDAEEHQPTLERLFDKNPVVPGIAVQIGFHYPISEFFL